MKNRKALLVFSALHPDVSAILLKYAGKIDFIDEVICQLRQTGALTDRQVTAVRRFEQDTIRFIELAFEPSLGQFSNSATGTPVAGTNSADCDAAEVDRATGSLFNMQVGAVFEPAGELEDEGGSNTPTDRSINQTQARSGTTMVGANVDRRYAYGLAKLHAETTRTKKDLLEEALHLLFDKYGMPINS